MKCSLLSTAMALGLILTLACVGLPRGTQMGHVVLISVADEHIDPREITVKPGDEVIFENRGSRTMWVYFDKNHRRLLSCVRGFSYALGVQQSAQILPTQSASLCFRSPGVYGYSVQDQARDVGGARLGQLSMEGAMPGAIIVEP